MRHIRRLTLVAITFILAPLAVHDNRARAAGALSLPESRPVSVPVEVPVPMMQFPPAQKMPFHQVPTMQFEPVPTFKEKPVQEFLDGSKLYQRNCTDCHGQLAVSRKRGISFSRFSSAITSQSSMENVRSLGRHEQQAIIDALR